MKRNLDTVSQETGQPSSFIYHIFRSPVPGAELINLVIIHVFTGKSVLMEKRPLVKFTRNFIWDSSGVLSIFLLVRISMMSFPAFILLFVQKYSSLYNKKKITRLEDI